MWGEFDMKGIFKTIDFAEYIVDRYLKKNFVEISAIKLQKVLYFLFAYWGAYIRNAKVGETEEKTLSNYSEYLFDDDIYAWTYGPVVKTVYNAFKSGQLKGNITRESCSIFNNDKYLESNINGLMDELFELSDFKLVGMAHLDECWKKNYDASAKRHNNIIDKEDIINEYAYKILQ